METEGNFKLTLFDSSSHEVVLDNSVIFVKKIKLNF